MKFTKRTLAFLFVVAFVGSVTGLAMLLQGNDMSPFELICFCINLPCMVLWLLLLIFRRHE